MLNLGISMEDFHAITWFTSWAVDADHTSDLNGADCTTDLQIRYYIIIPFSNNILIHVYWEHKCSTCPLVPPLTWQLRDLKGSFNGYIFLIFALGINPLLFLSMLY